MADRRAREIARRAFWKTEKEKKADDALEEYYRLMNERNIGRMDFMRRPSTYDYATPQIREALKQNVIRSFSRPLAVGLPGAYLVQGEELQPHGGYAKMVKEVPGGHVALDPVFSAGIKDVAPIGKGVAGGKDVVRGVGRGGIVGQPRLLYRTTGKTGLGRDYPGGIHFSTEEGGARYYAELYGKPGEISTWELASDAVLYDEVAEGRRFAEVFSGGMKTRVEKAKAAGYDGVIRPNNEVVVWNRSKLKKR